ncbi:MAG TPA: YARHG domain-containing protein [Cyclobacteriaceae bacterium]|nr:YARHG domain-containing protein [Cyclobacteriaceae bacterium]
MSRITILLVFFSAGLVHAQQSNQIRDALVNSCTGPGAPLDANAAHEIFQVRGMSWHAATTPINFDNGLAIVAYADRETKEHYTERFYLIAYAAKYKMFPCSNDEVVTSTKSIAEIVPLHDTFIKVATPEVTDYFVRYFDAWYVLKTFNKMGLRQLRNHVFARYGYRFKSEDLKEYFSKFYWYQPRFDNVDNLLTDEDKLLIKTIQAAEAAAKE